MILFLDAEHIPVTVEARLRDSLAFILLSAFESLHIEFKLFSGTLEHH
jgi:hypothetical protein